MYEACTLWIFLFAHGLLLCHCFASLFNSGFASVFDDVQLDGGAAVDETDEDGSTALIAAAWSGHVHVVDALLARGARVEAKNNTVRNQR